jgi:hypothetical protein
MNLKQLIGNNAYWTINKELARDIGLEATLLLQHLIDLEENYFKGEFWQTSESLQESVFLSKYLISKSIKVLEDKGYIEVENKVPNNSNKISKVYHFNILKETISRAFNQQELITLTDVGQNSLPTKVKEFNQVDKENNNKEKTNKVLDVPSDDDIKGKMFFKLVDMYPKNRVGNRQHALKKFKGLDIEQAKLALVNLKRYLNVAGTYIKNLQNYITEECYTEAWLTLEETKSKPKDITNTKEFDTNY